MDTKTLLLNLQSPSICAFVETPGGIKNACSLHTAERQMMVWVRNSRFMNKHKQIFSNSTVDIPKIVKHTYIVYFIRIFFLK